MRNLESILIEISTVRLAPSESELVFRSVDQMSEFIGVREYAMANEIIGSRLLSVVERNSFHAGPLSTHGSRGQHPGVHEGAARTLIRRSGYRRTTSSFPTTGPSGSCAKSCRTVPANTFIQVQLPHIESLKDVTLHLAPDDGGPGHDLRLDALGSAMLDLPRRHVQPGPRLPAGRLTRLSAVG